MERKHVLGAALCGAAVLVMVFVIGMTGAAAAPVLPDYSSATFVPGAPIDNPFSPLVPGTLFVYEGEVDDDGDTLIEHVEVFVTYQTRMVDGVSCVVVRDTAWVDDVLEELTDDWYAQDTAGNVWYMGEWSTGYEYNDDGDLTGTNHDGSWETGVDGALPGHVMEANPQIGDSYYQEYLVGEAEDQAEVLSLTESVSVPYGDYDNCLQTKETTDLELDVLEYKYYAAGVGLVRVEEFAPVEPEGPGEAGVRVSDLNDFELDFVSELISVEHVPPVPEPGAASLLMLGTLALVRRRRS